MKGERTSTPNEEVLRQAASNSHASAAALRRARFVGPAPLAE